MAVLNPSSRRGQEWGETVTKICMDRGIHVTSCEDSTEFGSEISKAVESGYSQIWIGGGDGTVRQAVPNFIGCPVILGILPMGTGNSLANELGIPAKPEQMVDFLLDQCEVKAIDVGQFNRDYFVNIATLGLTTKIADSLDTEKKKGIGRLAYIPALIHSLQTMKRFQVRISGIEGAFRGKATQIVVASSRMHGGPIPVTESASISDGLLSVYVSSTRNLAETLRFGIALVRGNHQALENVWSTETPHLTIELTQIRKFVLDGDFVWARSADIRILPHSVKVLAGKQKSQES